MKQKKQVMALILSLTLIFAVAGESTDLSIVSKAAGYGIGNPIINNGVTTWSCVYFGNYFQSNENTKEPIKWRVLSVNGDDAFLLADQNLDWQQYNVTEANNIPIPTGVPAAEESGSTDPAAADNPGTIVSPGAIKPEITWETCTLRSWLNGYGSGSNVNGIDYSSDNFLDQAFSPEEQKAILPAVVVNDGNPYYQENIGTAEAPEYVNMGKRDDTADLVYLLSMKEAAAFRYGFAMDFKQGNDARVALNTAHVMERNVAMNSAGMADCWWLRTSGISLDQAAYVGLGGYGYENGYVVDYHYCAVRPALHLDLTSSLWKDAGTVTSTATGQNAVRNNSSTNRNSTVTAQIKKPGRVTGLSVTAKKKGMKVSWKKKSDISGYQLQYARNKKFTKKAKTKNIKNYLGKKTIKGLRKYKTYYVRIRAYKMASGRKLYGKWSKVKKVKIK